ncbi:MAG: helix-turn-helix transcriptional regulator [Eubacteriales bacterium]|nr:helix-turn-helix transcriptional regulator [Eubacteriales bacterium]
MKQITDDEQKRIFSKNLSYFLSLNGMQQKDLANALKVQPSTVTNWIKQTSMPQVSTIQKIADYFKIGKSDLVDEKFDSADTVLDARILSDTETIEMIRKFYALSVNDRAAIKLIIESLYDKGKAEPNQLRNSKNALIKLSK